jgi:hypothetical protein
MVQTAEERARLLAERVGFAMTAFAMIETQLDFLFAASVSLPINISARMLASVKNFSTTLEVIDVAVRHKLEGSGALPYWLSLLEYVRELSGDRNYLAHTPMINHMPATGTFPIDPQQAQPLLGPPMSAFLGVNARRPPFDANEILEIIRDFEEAVKFTHDLNTAIAHSSLDKLSQPIQRRRPPRGKRPPTSPPSPV